MATLKALDPAPFVEVPVDAPELKLVAVEGARSPQGVTATIQAGNGNVQVARLVKLAQEADRDAFAQAVADATMVAPCFIREGLLDLMAGVEGALRQTEAQRPSHGQRPSQATALVELAAEAELFHDPAGDAFATVETEGHRETWSLRTRAVRRWLARRFYEEHGKAPGSQGLQDALTVLEGKALFDGPTYAVFTRLAEHHHCIYLDLANASWEVIEISATGWKLVATPPVKFRRSRGMLPLPVPVKGGTLDDLQPFTNMPEASASEWVLFKAWLVQALRPKGPYPLLLLHGEQGTAKSTQSKLARALIDPNAAPLRAEPRDVRDVMIAATNTWILAYDNLSHLPAWLSDIFCRLATGGGFSTRELYTDQEEVLFEAQRPIILNGIEELATRGDLLDRAMILDLPTIPKEKRRSEEAFWSEFEGVRPRILGALLQAVSVALRTVVSVTLEEMPRMADFAVWATAAESSLGLEPGAFMDAYNGNRNTAHELALEASLIVPPLRTIIAGGAWLGSATELLETLAKHVDEQTRKRRGWPGDGKALSNALRRLAPNLRGVGINTTFLKRQAGRRPIFIEQVDTTPDQNK